MEGNIILKILSQIKELRFQVLIIFMFVFVFMWFYENYLWWQRLKPMVVVLMFHSVDSRGPLGKDEDRLVVTPRRFSQIIKYLKSKGYNFINGSQLIELFNTQAKSGLNPNNKNILITFDDGYRDNYTNAYPILKNEGVKAVINIVVHWVEHYNVVTPGRYLLWKHINEMQKSGVIQIGSHSYNSHHYSFLRSRIRLRKGPILAGRMVKNGMIESEIDFINRVKNDLSKSREVIKKRTGEYPEIIAFPYGEAAQETKIIAEKLGFKVQMGIKPGINTGPSDLKNLKRIAVRQSETPEQLERRINYYKGVKLLLP